MISKVSVIILCVLYVVNRCCKAINLFLLIELQTVQILNDLLQIWIEQWYHKRPHDSLKGITPETAFKSDKRPLQFADPKLLADAFRYTKPAKVDKTGCLKFSGYVYEAGTAFIGRTVDILYNPESIEEIKVRCRGIGLIEKVNSSI